MPQSHTQNRPSGTNPDNPYAPSQRLFTAIPGIRSSQSKEQASKLLDCARHELGIFAWSRVRGILKFKLKSQ